MSIYKKVQIIFLVATFFVTAFFGAYFYIEKKADIQKKEKRYIQTASFMKNLYKISTINLHNENLQNFFDGNEFTLIESKKKIADIYQKASIEFVSNISGNNVQMLRVYGDFYLSIKHQDYSLLLQDMQERYFLKYIIWLYLISLLFLVVLYFWLIKSLTPLKTLQKEIQKITHGDLTVSLKSHKNDEIADVSNAFDDALRKLEALINSRQLFLRSIMHELKTPISKGKLLNEFLEDAKQKKSYDAVFERLNLLIEEFSKVEKMLSSSYAVKISKCNIIDVIEHSLELMIMDEEEISQKVIITEKSTYLIDTDFELLSLAIKNIIDNALKYSSDNKVQIEISKNGISISNLGKKLPQSLNTYLQPFSKNSHGLGLGLYIVQNIVKMLKLNLTYRYHNNKNIFFLSTAY